MLEHHLSQSGPFVHSDLVALTVIILLPILRLLEPRHLDVHLIDLVNVVYLLDLELLMALLLLLILIFVLLLTVKTKV